MPPDGRVSQKVQFIREQSQRSAKAEEQQEENEVFLVPSHYPDTAEGSTGVAGFSDHLPKRPRPRHEHRTRRVYPTLKIPRTGIIPDLPNGQGRAHSNDKTSTGAAKQNRWRQSSETFQKVS